MGHIINARGFRLGTNTFWDLVTFGNKVNYHIFYLQLIKKISKLLFKLFFHFVIWKGEFANPKTDKKVLKQKILFFTFENIFSASNLINVHFNRQELLNLSLLPVFQHFDSPRHLFKNTRAGFHGFDKKTLLIQISVFEFYSTKLDLDFINPFFTYFIALWEKKIMGVFKKFDNTYKKVERLNLVSLKFFNYFKRFRLKHRLSGEFIKLIFGVEELSEISLINNNNLSFSVGYFNKIKQRLGRSKSKKQAYFRTKKKVNSMIKVQFFYNKKILLKFLSLGVECNYIGGRPRVLKLLNRFNKLQACKFLRRRVSNPKNSVSFKILPFISKKKNIIFYKTFPRRITRRTLHNKKTETHNTVKIKYFNFFKKFNTIVRNRVNKKKLNSPIKYGFMRFKQKRITTCRQKLFRGSASSAVKTNPIKVNIRYVKTFFKKNLNFFITSSMFSFVKKYKTKFLDFNIFRSFKYKIFNSIRYYYNVFSNLRIINFAYLLCRKSVMRHLIESKKYLHRMFSGMLKYFVVLISPCMGKIAKLTKVNRAIFQISVTDKMRSIGSEEIIQYLLYRIAAGFNLNQVSSHLIRSMRYVGTFNGYKLCIAGRFGRQRIATYRLFSGGTLKSSAVSSSVSYQCGTIVTRKGVFSVKLWLRHRHVEN